GETDADHGETDTDCGGPNCDPCSEGKACEAGGDCRSGVCVDGTCAGRSHCNDNLKTGDETAVDCGGADCKACEPGKSCEKNRDCTTKFCNDGTCKEPSCDDGVTNGEETDVDCGGPDCPRCPANKACKRNQDCKSGVCDEGTCRSVPKSCEDLARAGITKDGVQEIDPDGGGGEKPFKVYCNMSHGKGGWTRLNLRKKADEGKKGLPFGSQGTKWADGSKLNWGQGSGYFQRPGDHHCTVYAIGDASRDKYKGKTTLWDYYDAEGNPIPPEQIEALAKTVDKGTFYEGKFDIVDIDGPFPNGGDGDGGKNSFSIAIDKNANHRPTGNGPLVLWFSRSPDMDKGTTHAIGSDFDSREDRTYGVDWKVVHDGGLPRFMGVKVDNNENLFSTFKNGCDREAGSRIAFEHPYFYVR
ncbi:MAG: fibrinogen-like YCDxxxxGGGW domain-containing protein, partial [Bradymonadaceae bacterium]